ncbi:MAG: NAD(P)/FAD-dependent oxidoreductase [Solirubrobacteraceae bacterium]
MHIVGAGNSAGQAAMFFSTHARTVTILCRGDTLQRSMSSYLIDQITTRPNIRTLHRSAVAAAQGDTSLDAIDVHDFANGETSRLESGGLFIFIAADAETGWLPPEIALDRRGFVLTGSDMRAAGHFTLDRDPYLLETSVPGIFACGDERFGLRQTSRRLRWRGSMATLWYMSTSRTQHKPPLQLGSETATLALLQARTRL